MEKEFGILKIELNQLVKLSILCQADKIPQVNFFQSSSIKWQIGP
jgi:hypothetical protein